MVLNYVWISFFVISFVVALIKSAQAGNIEIFTTIVESMLKTAKVAVVDIGIPLAGAMIFFLGLMKIAEKAGAINLIARRLNPFLKRLFPEIPENHPAMGEMVMNFSANMLGLDNAATPFGLKAMRSLEDINPEKGTASNSQIMFLVLHTSGLTLIPLSIIGYRVAANSAEPSSIFIPCVLATLSATLASILIVGIKQKLKFDMVLLSWLGALLAIIIGVLVLVQSLPITTKDAVTKHSGNFIMLTLIVSIVVGGMYKKLNVFDSFIEGAKDGFDVVLKIMPYLVGMLVAIAAFRECGALGYITDGIKFIVIALGLNADFVEALPVAIMKPFSGSGARGLLVDLFDKTKYPHLGPDSFVGKMASIFQGSADTTFYIIALYFGSVGIKNVRYSVWAGLLADFLGVIAAIIIGYIFFH
ncbi:MAG TPA: nucleoside recognition domain-containing protein [Chitinophagaceae bacterium]|nr:nucleoside recognition domain-containing protein [Chitinophagaceae bacterium]